MRSGTAPVARFLDDVGIGIEVADRLGIGAATSAGPAARLATATLAREAPDLFARGLAEGTAAARADYELGLADMRLGFDRQLTAQRQTWEIDEATRLTTQLSDGLNTIERCLAETAARVLKPFLKAAAQAQVAAQLIGMMERAITKNPGLVLKLQAPEQLIGVLNETLARRGLACTIEHSPDPEALVVAGGTILETRLGALLIAIEGAVA